MPVPSITRCPAICHDPTCWPSPLTSTLPFPPFSPIELTNWRQQQKISQDLREPKKKCKYCKGSRGTNGAGGGVGRVRHRRLLPASYGDLPQSRSGAPRCEATRFQLIGLRINISICLSSLAICFDFVVGKTTLASLATPAQ